MLDPVQLRNFLHVVELGTLSQAALRAHITQPALSRQIKELEEDVGCVLFERTGRGMRPTVDGVRLEHRARPLLTQLDNLQKEFVNAPISGPLTLCVTPSVGMAWASGLITRFRNLYPLVRLRVVVTLSGAAGEAIASGRVDVGVLYSPASSERLVTEELWQERTYFVCRQDHAHAASSKISLKSVLSSPLYLPSSSFGIRELLAEEALRLSVPLRVEMEVDSVQLALELVGQGCGNLVLTQRALGDIKARKLVAIPIVRPRLLRSAQISTSESALLRPAVRALWEFVIEESKSGSGV